MLWIKSDRERQKLYDFIHMWNIINRQNKWINQTKDTDTENRAVDVKEVTGSRVKCLKDVNCMIMDGN